jgi:hypothetical protein
MGYRKTILVGAMASLAVACANGGEGDDIGTFGDDSGGALDATHGGSHQDSGGSGSGGGFDSGAGGSDGAGGVGDAGMGDEGGGVVSCPAPNTCATVTNLGTIAGDQSGLPLTQSGYTSEWLVIDVQEKDTSSPLAAPMKLTATLTSPAGSNYDLYAYLGSATAVECSTVKTSSTNGAGQDDTISMTWGESGTFANGADDSAMVTLEIRYVSGPCTTSANWSLSAHGN